MLKSLLTITAAISSACMMSPIARADDAYVCDGGRLVYARPETLEKLKATDPCIQQFYGIVPAAPVPAAAANLAPASVPAQPAAPQGPGAPAKGKSAPSKSAPLKGTRDAGLLIARPKPVHGKAPEAAPGTDFRNVRVINAPAAEATVYHHDR